VVTHAFYGYIHNFHPTTSTSHEIVMNRRPHCMKIWWRKTHLLGIALLYGSCVKLG